MKEEQEGKKEELRHPAALADLRRLAEERARANEAQPPKTLSPEEAGRLIHELQVHQRLVNHPLRSLKPRGVIQELYALLIAHYIVRAFMHEAALDADVDPDRLSFVGALRIVQDALIEFQLADPACHPALLSRLLHDLAHERLPERRNRINPRVVKRTVIRFPRKRAEHAHPPQPSCAFREAVAVI